MLWSGGRQPIVIVGPTATGKTDAALALAEQIGGEIINADSVQVYRGLNIGSAKPDQEDQQRAPFHLLDVVAPDALFTVADWKTRAEAAIEDVFERGRQPIVCGGTGLYVRALLDDWSMAATPADPETRLKLLTELEEQGARVLHAQLQTIDPETAARLHPNDAVRITRALEVYRVTGKPISVYQAEDRQTRPPRKAWRFGLMLPRLRLNERIERRVDAMIASGLETEVRGLLALGYAPALGSLRSLGYREMAAYITKETDLPATIEEIKHNTRRFAKRQQTWFRADKLIHWIDVDGLKSAQIAATIMEDRMRQTEQ
jgi:tRNA dimethylallyltransferase